MHTTHDNCCPERVTIEIMWCSATSTYRVRGQWNPEQLQFFDDAVHDVEVVAENVELVRAAVVMVLREHLTLLRLSEVRANRTSR